MAQGLMGYAFTCPDLIGGGEFESFLDGAAIDQELVVRSAQVHALMPMMQFSAAPWRVLTPAQNAICHRMAELHASQARLILDIARWDARTGESIIRPQCWQWPGAGYEHINDQFMLGDDGSLTTGPLTKGIAVPIERPPGSGGKIHSPSEDPASTARTGLWIRHARVQHAGESESTAYR